MPAGGAWVLVAEDDGAAREAVCRLLRAAGYAALPAADGRQALAALRRPGPPPLAVLLDLNMPDVDGWEVLDQRRGDKALAAVPVLVISGEAGAEDALAAGAEAVLRKPLRPAALLAALARLASDAAAAAGDEKGPEAEEPPARTAAAVLATPSRRAAGPGGKVSLA